MATFALMDVGYVGDKLKMNERALLIGLQSSSAPRFFTTEQFHDFVKKTVGIEGSDRSINRWLDALASARILKKVRRGLFLNGLSKPQVKLAEVVHLIRSGAVVDLMTVLGDCGALNNLPTMVTCVIPLKVGIPTPSIGIVEAEVGKVQFFGMSSSVFHAGALEDREAATAYERSTPEAALLNWIYLSENCRSRLTSPPLDIDLTLLDKKTLSRLARAKGLTEQYHSWKERVLDYQSSPKVEANSSVILGF